ncbi:hypothetical protein [Sphingomonas sp. LM7]|uniref:hypothetical protein n=1 Tax=Sphingomonas sp. LM7 TaxID=1938607 RepID=UPI000983EE6D|nr:hypothetical protein [Sphingomonas sp. LM7]AQR73553.1 hypothetical protein BXU08_07780 [Sphingomonas sp. LM7]
MTPLLLLLGLAGAELDCGGAVVSGTGSIVSLYDNTGAKVVDLKVKDNSLAEPLPIIRCSATMMLVNYKGRQLRADRYQVVTRDAIEGPPCTRSGGDLESRSSARTMNGLARLSCPDTKPTPAAAPARKPARKGKR